MSAGNLQKAFGRLASKVRGFKPLAVLPAKGPRPGEVAIGRSSVENSRVLYTLVEEDYEEREYWPPVFAAVDSIGVFVLEVEPIRSVSLQGDRTIEFKQLT